MALTGNLYYRAGITEGENPCSALTGSVAVSAPAGPGVL